MASFRTLPLRGDDMPKVIRVELPEGIADSKKANGQWLPAMLDPEILFMVAWINCRRRHEVVRELRDQRVRFLVRMAAL